MPATAVRSRPDQSEHLEERVIAVWLAAHGADGVRAGHGADGVRAGRAVLLEVVVVPDGDGGLAACLAARVDVEYRDAVTGRGLAPRGPRRRLHGAVGSGRAVGDP